MKQLFIMATTILSAATAFAQTNTQEEQAVKGLISTIESGWNKKSGEAFASAFADTHDYIVVNGMYFSDFTREANATAHQNLFDGPYKNIEVKLKVDKVDFLRTDLALIHAFGGRTEKGKPMPEDPAIIMTVIAEKKNDVWKIISFHNHELDSNLKKTSAMPMNVMFASWYKK